MIDYKFLKIQMDKCLNRYQWFLVENVENAKFISTIRYETKKDTFLDIARLSAMQISMDLLDDYPDDAWIYDRLIYYCLEWTGWNFDRFLEDRRTEKLFKEKVGRPSLAKKGKRQKGAKDESQHPDDDYDDCY